MSYVNVFRTFAILGATALCLPSGAAAAPSAGAAGGVVVAPLVYGFNTASSKYLVTLTLGGQPFNITVDTGSADLIVGAYNCSVFTSGNCSNPVGPFTPCPKYQTGYRPGPTATSLGITERNYYGGGAKGWGTCDTYQIYTDMFGLAGVSTDLNTRQAFGAINLKSGGGNPYSHGIIGMAYGGTVRRVVGKNGGNVMSSMFKNGVVGYEGFSLCLHPSGVGGKLVFGGGAQPGMKYVTQTNADSSKKLFYRVSFDSISVGNQAPSTPEGSTAILDSGTVQLQLPSTLKAQVDAIICPALAAVGAAPIGCKGDAPTIPSGTRLAVTANQLSTLPNITVTLGGLPFVLTPSDYTSTIGGKVYYEVSQGKPTIMGLVVLKGYWSFFDRKNGRIGFVPVAGDCDSMLTNML